MVCEKVFVGEISLSLIFLHVPFVGTWFSFIGLGPGVGFECFSSSLFAFSLDSDEAERIEDELPVLLQVLTRGSEEECLLCSRFQVPARLIGSREGLSEWERAISCRFADLPSLYSIVGLRLGGSFRHPPA